MHQHWVTVIMNNINMMMMMVMKMKKQKKKVMVIMIKKQIIVIIMMMMIMIIVIMMMMMILMVIMMIMIMIIVIMIMEGIIFVAQFDTNSVLTALSLSQWCAEMHFILMFVHSHEHPPLYADPYFTQSYMYTHMCIEWVICKYANVLWQLLFLWK